MGKTKKYHGVVVPMVTPFTEDGQIDIPAAMRVTEHLIKNDTTPFVLGTTGEAASIPDSARPSFVEAVVRQTAGRTMVYVGIASNCLNASVEAAKRYFDLGMDVAVAHLPCYYPLVPDQMLKYFETLADSIPAPLMLYNITITTHMSIPLDVVEKLSHHPNIVGLKDSEKNTERFEQALEMWRDRDDFAHFTGSAALSAWALSLGSDGIVPSTGNFVPKMFHDLYDAAVKGDTETANKLQKETDEIARIYQKNRVLSQSLAALKVIMNQMGLCGEAVLPPLHKVGPDEKTEIKAKLAKFGLTN